MNWTLVIFELFIIKKEDLAQIRFANNKFQIVKQACFAIRQMLEHDIAAVYGFKRNSV